MKFRPCIDLHNGKVKQIVGSSLSDTEDTVATNFESSHSPAYYSNMYQEDKLTGGHVIKLGPGNDTAAQEALQAYPKGLQIGGGITAENAQTYIEMGASHIIVTSYVFKEGNILWENIHKLVDKVGKESIVFDLSCKKKDDHYYIVTDRWQNLTKRIINKETIEELSQYCCEFLVHAADVEGKQAGIDNDLLTVLADTYTIPTTYAGGIHCYDDIKAIEKIGNSLIDYTVGSALDIFGGKLKYRTIVDRKF